MLPLLTFTFIYFCAFFLLLCYTVVSIDFYSTPKVNLCVTSICNSLWRSIQHTMFPHFFGTVVAMGWNSEFQVGTRSSSSEFLAISTKLRPAWGADELATNLQIIQRNCIFSSSQLYFQLCTMDSGVSTDKDTLKPLLLSQDLRTSSSGAGQMSAARGNTPGQ